MRRISITASLLMSAACGGEPPDTPQASPPVGSSPAAPAPAAGKEGASKGITLVLRRRPEPNQRAFTVLVPEGWTTRGGLFSVDPMQAGGTLNSIDTKCDFLIGRDAAATVAARWAPSWNHVDFSRNPEFAMTAGMFPPGSRYNGALVKPMPAVDRFLDEFFAGAHPGASEVRVVERIPLPELAEICAGLVRGVNATLAGAGKPPMTFSAGAVVVEYAEGGLRFREALATALCDFRAAAGIWSNQFTFHMRAPAEEAGAWKPVLDIVRQSLRIDPGWLARYTAATKERGETAAEVFRTLARIDQEIFERRSRRRSEIANESYLLLTGQEEYVNPYTKEVERDGADYEHRWTTAGGDRIYTDRQGFDPNRDPELGKIEWKRTPVRPR